MNCDAMIPECGWPEQALCDMGLTEYCNFTALHVSKTLSVKFHRDGNTLYGAGSIMLFDVNGNLVRSVGAASSSKAEMQLQGLRQGNYIAKCQGQVMQVQIR